MVSVASLVRKYLVGFVFLIFLLFQQAIIWMANSNGHQQQQQPTGIANSNQQYQ
jgi:hypothetical protein